MIPLNTLLGRVSLQLTDVADRLSLIETSGADGRREIIATQAIDYAEQMNRALSSVLAAIAQSDAASDVIETDALLAGLPLDDLRLALAGRVVRPHRACEPELF